MFAHHLRGRVAETDMQPRQGLLIRALHVGQRLEPIFLSGRTRTGDHPTLMIVEYNAIITTEGSRLPSLTQLSQAFERRRDGAAPPAPVRQNERPSTLLPAAACKMFNPFGRNPSFPLSLPHNISTSEEPTAAAVCGALK